MASIREHRGFTLNGFLALALFLGLALYVPFLCNLFHFSTLHPDDLALCLAAGLLSVMWFEGLKVFRKKWLAAS